MSSLVAWGIDIGRSSLKAVKVRSIRGDLEIESLHYFRYEDVYPGASFEDASREAMGRLIDAVGAKVMRKETVAVCLPGQIAFSRFLELPPVDEKKIDETIRLEAKQQIPFPIENVNWGYHKINLAYKPGDQVEIGIFAIKKEMVKDFIDNLKGHGIEPELLTIAPLAIYNFVAFDCKTTGGAIVLDVGADQTNLVIVDGPRLWLRNLPIAGNEFTRSLEDKFQIPFKEAEKLKTNAKKSSNAKKIFSVMQPVLKDFLGEIQRSLGFYKSKHKKAKLSRILMTGGGTKLFNLAAYLNSQLDYKVRRVQRLNNFSIDREADMDLLDSHLPSFSVALGLAVQAVGAADVDVNLLPREDVQRKTIQSKAAMIFAGAAVLLFCALLSWFLQSTAVASVRAEVDGRLTSKEYESVIEAKNRLQEAVDSMEKPMTTIRDLEVVFAERRWALEIFQKLEEVIPDASGLPWRGEDGKRAAVPEELPEDNPQAWALPASGAMNTVNNEKTWVLGVELERVIENASRYYKVRLTVAKTRSALPAVLLEKIKSDIGARITTAFSLPDLPGALQVATTDIASLLRVDPTASNTGNQFFQVEFSWSYPVESWMEAEGLSTKPADETPGEESD